MKKIMKKIIMMVLIIATVLSGITVPTRKAEALILTDDTHTVNDLYDKEMGLLGYTKPYTEEAEKAYVKSYGYTISHADSWEILWFSDKDGNVIVDDRKIGLHTDDEIELTGWWRSIGNSMGVTTQSISDDYYKPVDVIEGIGIKLNCADLYDAKGSGEPRLDATWSSDNPDIAEVSQDGTVTAKKPGKAVIRAVATENGKEATREINVLKNQYTRKQKLEKCRTESTMYFDKNGDAICKTKIKNTSKKKYKYIVFMEIKDNFMHERLKQYKLKVTLKPGKSKTLKVKVKALDKSDDLTKGYIRPWGFVISGYPKRVK